MSFCSVLHSSDVRMFIGQIPTLVLTWHPSASRDWYAKVSYYSKEAFDNTLKSYISNFSISSTKTSHSPKSHLFSLVPYSTLSKKLKYPFENCSQSCWEHYKRNCILQKRCPIEDKCVSGIKTRHYPCFFILK